MAKSNISVNTFGSTRNNGLKRFFAVCCTLPLTAGLSGPALASGPMPFASLPVHSAFNSNSNSNFATHGSSFDLHHANLNSFSSPVHTNFAGVANHNQSAVQALSAIIHKTPTTQHA